MAEAKIDVRINAGDLDALRALAERMERAAQQTEVLTSLRLPLPPGACRACEAKDRGLHLEQLARIHYAKLLDEKHFNLIEVKKECEALAAALEIERSAHNVTRESLKGTTRKEARLEQECEALKKVNDNALAELRRQRASLERESAEHYAMRIRLRDALCDAAKYAMHAHNLAIECPGSRFKARAKDDAAQFEAARAALGLDEIALPPAAGETAKGEHVTVSLDMKLDLTPDASTASETARLFDEQVMGYAESKGEPAPARRRRFRAGDRVRLPAQTTVYSAVLDENDAGSVAIEVSRNELNCISTSALTLIEPTHRARRNRELAFHFHRWSISTDADAMDSVPEFVRVAAEQLLRDPFGTEYGSVLADVDAKTGGAK